MNIKHTIAALSTAAAFAVATPATAQVPVIDQTAIGKWITQLQSMADQLTTMRNTFTAITGTRNLLQVFNTQADQTARTAANSMNDIVNGAISGNAIAGNVAGINASVQQLRSTFDLGNIGQLLGSQHPLDRAIATQAGSGVAAMATADDAYKRADAAVSRINRMVVDMDASADLQATGAYTNVLLAEVATLLAENLRVQAAIAQSLGANTTADARDSAAARKFIDIEP